MKKEAQAYEEIFAALDKYQDVVAFDIGSLRSKSEAHLFGVKLRDQYGLNINPKIIENPGYIDLRNEACIATFGKEYGRTISWSADGRQPDNELLLKIGFCTGAYMFGNDYPTDFFEQFFTHLKTFAPKYVDDANHCLYWSMDNAKDIWNVYPELLKEWHQKNKEDLKERRKKHLMEELAKLDSKPE